MQESYIVAAIGAVVVLTLIALFIVVANTQKTIIVKVQENGVEEEEKPHITIEALSEIAAKRKTSKNELTKAVLEASKYCPFPQKIKGVAPKSSKIYLNFILLVASHQNADAKLIAFMDTELKKANPDYKTEIDIYENEGIHQRGNRI
jgi:hypothetical protein